MFTEEKDIVTSPNLTKNVGRNYYDNTTTTLYDLIKTPLDTIRANAFQMALEMRSPDGFGESNKNYSDESELE